MSRAVLPLLLIAGGCGLVGDGSSVAPVSAAWMEWPSEVRSGTAFGVRIVGFLPSCGSKYMRRYTVEASTITFSPFAIVPDEPPCENFAPPMFIDSIVFGGLELGTYQLRSRGEVFGELQVRADPGESRWNAAGRGSIEPDYADCIRVRPSVLPAVRELPVENPPDPTPASGFVTGYILSEATPLCGETTVFHLVSQN